jgi:hypothetical protein
VRPNEGLHTGTVLVYFTSENERIDDNMNECAVHFEISLQADREGNTRINGRGAIWKNNPKTQLSKMNEEERKREKSDHIYKHLPRRKKAQRVTKKKAACVGSQ